MYMRTDGGLGNIAWGTRSGVGNAAWGTRRRAGMSEYDPMATPWTWMYYPPPYDFADPNPTIPPPTFIAPAEEMGMGHLGCGCGCSGGDSCGGSASAVNGLGQLFSSGFDISGWGVGEWSVVALGAFAVYSVFFTTKSAASSVSGSMRRRSSRARRKAALQAELNSF